MSIIFALPRHEYASYRDLYTLIDLSGFQKVFIDEIDPQSDNAYVITILNGEVPPGGYPGARAQIALWDLEYHLEGVHVPGVKVWAADKWYAEQIGAKYVPMGSHEGLSYYPNEPLDVGGIDVAYMGFIAGLHRREVIRQQLIERGVKVSPMVAWNGLRHAILSSSKAYLHVHQHEHIPTIAPLRMVVAAAYGLPVLSETCADVGVFTKGKYLESWDYQHLDYCVSGTIQDAPDTLRLMGQWLHQFLCHDYPFRKSVEAGLS